MGAIGGLFGSAGGANGTGFAGPQLAPLIQPTNADQISQAYQGVQGGLTSQQQLLSALQQQQGINNQSQVYNQLQNVAAGQGPNPAQAMLNQSTGQNVANQAALMAGQRGAGSNVGLIARQAAQQGANTQQQAVGQGATMQANQSLNAIGQAGQLATQQAGQQIGQTNANVQAQQGEQSNLLGALGQYNQSQVANQASVNSGNAALAGQTMQGQQGLIGGVMNGIGSIFADGGEVEKMADGGLFSGLPNTSTPGVSVSAPTQAGAASKFGQFLHAMSNPQSASNGQMANMAPTSGAQSLQRGAGSIIGNAFGKKAQPTPADVPIDQSTMAGGPDDSDLSADTMNAAHGGNVGTKLKKGGHVPGKAPVPGPVNNYKNDVVDAKLSPGEIVIPNKITKGSNPAGDAAKFVQAIIAKRGKK